MARVVVPGVGHHVTQRGNRRCDVFADDADRMLYLSLLGEYAERHGMAISAYCLMTNHVHFVATPSAAESPARTFRDTHQACAAKFNRKTGESGHLWQGRFFSTALDERHFWSAVRYVERNPVRAGLVARAWEYRWSSAAAHCGLRADPLLSGDLEQADHVGDWKAFLSSEDEAEVRLLRRQTRTGRPCGGEAFVRGLEALLGRRLLRRKPGPKPKRKA
jgi:putative transposase